MFNNEQLSQERHNRLNFRDTSTEPNNLNGDANLSNKRGMRNYHRNSNHNMNDADLNDRVSDDDVPPLEHIRVQNP